MTRQEFLKLVHAAYRPRSYLEVGVGLGRSLALSRTRTIGVDPAFRIKAEIHCDIQLVKAPSDEFFARADALAHFPEGRVDFAFIDGLHLFEFALRDFMNVERHAEWTSVIVLDDIFPGSAAEASRERGTVMWTGDVFKITQLLAEYRPDLVVLPLDVEPTGLLLVVGADPASRVLEDNYDEIVAEYVHPDPQQVPAAVLRRETAFDPESLDPSVWEELRRAREAGLPRAGAWEGIRSSLQTSARPASPRDPASPTPPRGSRIAVRRLMRPLRRGLRRFRG